MLMTEMFETMQSAARFDEEDEEAPAMSPYNDMLPRQMAEAMASAGGLGMARWFEGQIHESAHESAHAEFIAPVEGRISSGFGEVRHNSATGKEHVHQGIDVPAAEGTPILASASGRVIFSGQRQGYGETIEVLHPDGALTRYAHCRERLVEVGDPVLQGQPIGKVGSTGRSTGAHLHFEVSIGGQWQDPARWLKEGGS